MREGTRKSRAPSGVERHSCGVSTSRKPAPSRKPRIARIMACRSCRLRAMRGRLHAMQMWQCHPLFARMEHDMHASTACTHGETRQGRGCCTPQVQHPRPQPHFLLHLHVLVRRQEGQLGVDRVQDGDLQPSTVLSAQHIKFARKVQMYKPWPGNEGNTSSVTSSTMPVGRRGFGSFRCRSCPLIRTTNSARTRSRPPPPSSWLITCSVGHALLRRLHQANVGLIGPCMQAENRHAWTMPVESLRSTKQTPTQHQHFSSRHSSAETVAIDRSETHQVAPPRFLCRCTQPQRVNVDPTSASDSVPHPLSLPFQLMDSGTRSLFAAGALAGWASTVAAQALCSHRLLCGEQDRVQGNQNALCNRCRRPNRQQCLPSRGSSPLLLKTWAMPCQAVQSWPAAATMNEVSRRLKSSGREKEPVVVSRDRNWQRRNSSRSCCPKMPENGLSRVGNLSPPKSCALTAGHTLYVSVTQTA